MHLARVLRNNNHIKVHQPCLEAVEIDYSTNPFGTITCTTYSYWCTLIWRSQGVTIPFFMRDKHVCVHEHFGTKNFIWRPVLISGIPRMLYGLLSPAWDRAMSSRISLRIHHIETHYIQRTHLLTSLLIATGHLESLRRGVSSVFLYSDPLCVGLEPTSGVYFHRPD